MCGLTISDILTLEVDCSNPDDSLKTVTQTLARNNVSCCVVASENKIPLGILSERDLIRIISENENISKLMDEPVSLHMSSPPFTLPEDTTLEDALNCIDDRNLRYLLVTAVNGSITGILTQTDMVQAHTRVMRNQSEVLEKTVEERTEQLESVNRKLVTLSLVDPLTGLGNRRAMEVDIMKIHASGIRHRRPYSIVLFDIDFFKKYNDHYGHQAGDKALIDVTRHLRNGIRETDAIYRYGGEEFLMAMPDTDIAAAIESIQRIIKELYDINIPHHGSLSGRLTISAGIACSHHQGQRLASWRQVVELADEGLYDAKNSGRNKVVVSQPSTLQSVQKMSLS